MLTKALRRATQMVADEFRGVDLGNLEQLVPAGVKNKWASQEMAHAHDLSMASMNAGRSTGSDLSMLQEQVSPGV